MKNILTILALATAVLANSQNLENKISDKAALVLSFNGNVLLNSISQVEIENSLLFDEIVHEFFRHKNHIESFSELGAALDKQFCFVIEQDEDVMFYYLVFEMENVNTFESYLKKNEYNQIGQKNGVKFLEDHSNENIFWNDKIAVILSADYTGEEFATNYHDYTDYYDSYYQAETVEMAVEEAKCEEGKCEDGEMVEDVERIEKTEAQIKEEEERKKYIEEQRKLQEEREKKIAEKKNKRKDFVQTSIKNRIGLFFGPSEHPNKVALSTFDDNANVNFWMNTQKFDLYNPLDFFRYTRYGYGWGYGRGRNGMSFSDFFGSQISANLFLTESEINVKSKVVYSDKLAKAFENVYSSKLNKDFLNYVSDKPLGYFSMSMNTEELLKAYGDIASDFISESEMEYGEAISVYVDFISILIDEKELGELITGDALFVMHDITEQEYEYTTYEYNENFESKKVKKTKKGMLPEMTLMFGSERESFFTKIMDLGVKEELLTNTNSIYTLSKNHRYNEMPFDLFFYAKDDIVFATNSQTQLANIIRGKSLNKIKGDGKKHISKNMASSYINFNGIVEKIMMDEDMGKELKFMNSIKDDLTDMTSTSTMKNGQAETEMIISVPEGHKNASIYLLHFIDKFIGETKRH
jgi:hypothetical protein